MNEVFIYLFIYQEPTDIPSSSVPEVGVSEEGVAVRSSSCEV